MHRPSSGYLLDKGGKKTFEADLIVTQRLQSLGHIHNTVLIETRLAARDKSPYLCLSISSSASFTRLPRSSPLLLRRRCRLPSSPPRRTAPAIVFYTVNLLPVNATDVYGNISGG